MTLSSKRILRSGFVDGFGQRGNAGMMIILADAHAAERVVIRAA